MYLSTLEPLGPVNINPLFAAMKVLALPGPVKDSPIKLMAPLPVATTLDPICCSLTV
jgi:hypothetical protein